jgi:hypothetical protein
MKKEILLLIKIQSCTKILRKEKGRVQSPRHKKNTWVILRYTVFFQCDQRWRSALNTKWVPWIYKKRCFNIFYTWITFINSSLSTCKKNVSLSSRGVQSGGWNAKESTNLVIDMLPNPPLTALTISYLLHRSWFYFIILVIFSMVEYIGCIYRKKWWMGLATQIFGIFNHQIDDNNS